MTNTDDYILARVRALLTVYREVWDTKWRSEFDILDVEREFSFPLLNPDTEAASRTFVEAGKMDVLARRRATGKLCVIEHKTTSDSIEPASDYWDRLRLDVQCSKYFLAAAHGGQEVGEILYDVIHKPAQRPCLVPELDADGYKIVLDAAGQRVFTKTGKPRETGDSERGYALQGRLETPGEFEARLVEVLRANPAMHYAHRETPRLDSDLLEYMRDAWVVSQQILHSRSHNLWQRNPDACSILGGCEFWDLCCGRASVDGIRFRQREKVHPELTIQPSSKEFLTVSRTRALHRCPRLHWLRYEEKIERVEEDKDARFFGTLIHQGLEKYFRSLITTENTK